MKSLLPFNSTYTRVEMQKFNTKAYIYALPVKWKYSRADVGGILAGKTP